MSLNTNCCVFILRPASIFLAVSIVVAIIYFTPFPDIENNYANCNRPCHELDWPMICRFQFVVEARRTLNKRFCGDCPNNATDCTKHHCLIGDGSARKIITANKRYPGPSMHVCENDILVVEVVNRVAGHSVTLHWRGQPLQETPSMDGVPMVTQCPVPTYTTFQYKLRASTPGTHLWQAMSGDSAVDELFGALVVRRSTKMEPHQTLYDVDSPEHLILLSEWSSKSGKSAILINGRSNGIEDKAFPVQAYNVTKGKRYRFRVAYATSHTGCPLSGEIAAHGLLILALDGHSILPRKVDSFKIAPGERIDFVLNADQSINKYRIRFTLSDWCSSLNVESYAILAYNTSDPSALPVTELSQIKKTVLTTVQGVKCGTPDIQCLSDLKSLQKLPENLVKNNIDVKFNFKLLEHNYSTEEDIEDDDYDVGKLKNINNITFAFPSSPLYSRNVDVPDDESLFCNEHKKPVTCSPHTNSCQCTHVVTVPLMASVRIAILNPGPSNNKSDQNYTFHLHGLPFHVIYRGELKNSSAMDLSGESLGTALSTQLNPVLKDTVSIPRRSFAILRFTASNPGYWMLHEGRSQLWSKGMAVVLKVGEHNDFPQVPDNFPKCGNWIGPEFFLA